MAIGVPLNSPTPSPPQNLPCASYRAPPILRDLLPSIGEPGPSSPQNPPNSPPHLPEAAEAAPAPPHPRGSGLFWSRPQSPSPSQATPSFRNRMGGAGLATPPRVKGAGLVCPCPTTARGMALCRPAHFRPRLLSGRRSWTAQAPPFSTHAPRVLWAWPRPFIWVELPPIEPPGPL